MDQLAPMREAAHGSHSQDFHDGNEVAGQAVQLDQGSAAAGEELASAFFGGGNPSSNGDQTSSDFTTQANFAKPSPASASPPLSTQSERVPAAMQAELQQKLETKTKNEESARDSLRDGAKKETSSFYAERQKMMDERKKANRQAQDSQLSDRETVYENPWEGVCDLIDMKGKTEGGSTDKKSVARMKHIYIEMKNSAIKGVKA